MGASWVRSAAPSAEPGRPTISSTSRPRKIAAIVTLAALPAWASRRTCTTTRSPSCSRLPRGRTSLCGRKAGLSPPISTSAAPSAGKSLAHSTEMNAPGLIAVAAFDEEFDGNALFEQRRAPLARARGYQELAIQLGR